MQSTKTWSIAKRSRRGRRDHPRSSGNPMLSALGALSILALAVLGCWGTLRSGLVDVSRSSELHPATHYLDETLLDVLSGATYEDVASRKGALGHGASTNLYRVSFAVNEERHGLLAIEAVLFDRVSGRELDRITTYRTQRATDPKGGER